MIKDAKELAQHIQDFLEEFSTNTAGFRVVLIVVGDTGLNVLSDSLNAVNVVPILHAAFTGAVEEVERMVNIDKGELH